MDNLATGCQLNFFAVDLFRALTLLNKIIRCRSTRSRFFAKRIVLVWNSLPTSVKFASLSGLKNFLLGYELI